VDPAESAALEAQVKDYMHKQEEKSTALATSPVSLEQITKANGQKITQARATSGKFIRKSTATALLLADQAQKFALAKSEQDAALTNAELMRKKMLEVFMAASGEKSLIGLAKIFQTLICDATGAKQILEEAIKAESEKKTPNIVTHVLIAAPPGILPMEEKKVTTKPSFAEVLGIEQNGPSGMPKEAAA